MKFKKEYIALFVIIVVLVIYLVLRTTDKTHYKLPELEPVEKSQITQLIIARADSAIILKLVDDRWQIEPQGYPTDQSTVDKMLDAVSEFTLTTLVSQSKDYHRYELTDEKKIGIEVFGRNGVLRKFDIGKTASTYRHTYVRLEGDPAVYQARENMRTTFDTELERLRDKSVLSFEKETVTSVVIESRTESLTLKNTEMLVEAHPKGVGEEGGEGSGEETAEAGSLEGAEREPESKWQTPGGETADDSAVDRILTSLSNLKCDKYIYGKTKDDLTEPVFTVTVEGTETVSLSIFEQENNQYPAVSSQNDYPFLLPEYRVKQIMKKPDELLKKEEGK